MTNVEATVCSLPCRYKTHCNFFKENPLFEATNITRTIAERNEATSFLDGCIESYQLGLCVFQIAGSHFYLVFVVVVVVLTVIVLKTNYALPLIF